MHGQNDSKYCDCGSLNWIADPDKLTVVDFCSLNSKHDQKDGLSEKRFSMPVAFSILAKKSI